MRVYGAGDSPLGWRGIPSRTQTLVCISAPFLSFVQSGTVLSISLSERMVHGRTDARDYRKRPPQGRTGKGPDAGIGSARQLGRASARVRVCQSVEIAGGAGVEKKNKE